jgi:hypothetical protein
MKCQTSGESIWESMKSQIKNLLTFENDVILMAFAPSCMGAPLSPFPEDVLCTFREPASCASDRPRFYLPRRLHYSAVRTYSDFVTRVRTSAVLRCPTKHRFPPVRSAPSEVKLELSYVLHGQAFWHDLRLLSSFTESKSRLAVPAAKPKRREMACISKINLLKYLLVRVGLAAK